MKLKLLFIAAFLSPTPLLANSPDEPSPLATVTVENGQVMTYEQLLMDRKLTGLSIAVVDDYKLVYSHSAGQKEQGGEAFVDENTAFSTASISKAVTGTIAVMLAENKILDLDAPVEVYLKRWQLPKSAFTAVRPVTLRDLLSHTAGTTQGGFEDFYLGDAIPSLIDSLNGVNVPNYSEPIAVTFEPGSDWKYSGGGYGIIQLALEDITGKSLAQLAEEMIFGPLDMRNTTMYQHGHASFPHNVAKVHDHKQQVIGTGIPICPQTSASGMWSTALDMAKFMVDFQKALAGSTTQTISPWVATETTRIHSIEKLGGWGLGWARHEAHGNLDWFSHGGANTGTGGHILSTMRGGRAIIIFINGPNRTRVPLIDEIVSNILNKLEWSVPLLPSQKPASIDLIRSIEGRYLSTFENLVTIGSAGGKLTIHNARGAQKSMEMVYVGEDRFEISEFHSQLSLRVSPVDGQEYLARLRKGSHLLTYAMRKLHSDEKLPFEVAMKGSLEATIAAYKSWQQQNPTSRLLDERTINYAGYMELQTENYVGALNFFNLNIQLHPNSANAFDSLAEGYLVTGDQGRAAKFYARSLELNPKNENAKKMLQQITASLSGS